MLAFLVATQNTYASTLIASFFIARLGAGAIPIYYLFFALVSIPLSVAFSSVIDRFPRHKLFAAMLWLFIAISGGLSLLLSWGEPFFYVVYLGISVCEHLLYSIFYVLFADHFTVTEAKRSTSRMALGMAGGGVAGGALASLGGSSLGPQMALLLTPLLVVLVIAYLGVLVRRHEPIDAIESAEESIVESLRIIPHLIWRYPMVALLSAAMFLNILLQCLSEYLAFSIYTIHYPSVQAMAGFLGMVHAGLNLLGFLIVVLFTERQLPRLGVPKMNLVYPGLNTLSFAVLSVNSSLPAGVLANIAYDPFEHSIGVPVTAMNYNAVRYRFLGRVRVFVDGVIYPLALAIAGGLLIVSERYLSLKGIAIVGLGGSLLFFIVHRRIGIHYVSGLIDMLRDGAVDLDRVGSGLKIQPEHVEQISAMLVDSDPRTAHLGLQMAASADHGFAAFDIGTAVATVSAQQAANAFARFASSGGDAGRQTLTALTEDPRPLVRRRVLEHAICSDARLPQEQLAKLMDDPDQGIRSLGAAACLAANADDRRAQTILRETMPADIAVVTITILQRLNLAHGATVLTLFASHPDPAVRAATLAASASLAPDDPATLMRARAALTEAEPAVRAQAAAVVTRLAPADELTTLADTGLEDDSPLVRQAVAHALAERGEAATSALAGKLHSEREEVQRTAIDALGAIAGADASGALYKALEPTVFRQIPLIQRLAASHPPGRPGWLAIEAALADAKRRSLHLVMHALAALGHRRTLNLVRVMIKAVDERARANAVESLSSLPQRRFITPVLPLLEDGDAREVTFDRATALQVLDEAAASPNAWFRAAALVARHAETGNIPATALDDPSPIVAETARRLAAPFAANPPYREDAPMNRLAFLHGVPLFAEATLDELVALDQALGCESYLGSETIVSEGDPGDRLCIVFRGEVAVRKGEREIARLTAGDFFGEMSLFDDEPRSATVAALGPVEVLVLERERFQSLVRQRPELLMEFCRTLVVRLRKAQAQA